MTRLGRRATLLVALYLLTSAATAYAQCAWVLWGQIIGQAAAPSGAWSSREECQTERTRLQSFRSREQQEQDRRDGFMFVCLPDTVDPRGPKGK